MNERISPLAMLIGTVVSGLSAVVVGPVVLFSFEALSRAAGNPTPEYDFWSSVQVMGFVFGAIGTVVAVFVGFPLLLTLRNVGRLNLASATIAGAGMGLLIAMLFWIMGDMEPIVLLLGCTVGALCGWSALAVAYVVPVRPNKSLERRREG